MYWMEYHNYNIGYVFEHFRSELIFHVIESLWNLQQSQQPVIPRRVVGMIPPEVLIDGEEGDGVMCWVSSLLEMW